MTAAMERDSAVAGTVPDKPYKGLEPFAEEDAPFFFGRPRDRERVIANLFATRLTLLYGESGVGKSSLLRAGVAATLRARARENLAQRGGPGHAVVVWREWRENPLAGLKDAVQAAVAEALGEPGFDPPIFGSSLADVLHQWSNYLNGYLLIVLDQFEDYLLYHPASGALGSPDDELIQAISRPDLRANFLLSIREDAVSRLDRFQDQVPALFDNLLRVERLDREQAREAIVGPLKQWAELGLGEGRPVGIEPELVERLLEEIPTASRQLSEVGSGSVDPATAGRDIPAPYLQLVLERLWDRERARDSSYIHASTLDELHGVAEIVRTHLDTVMHAFPPEQRAVAAAIFRDLVTPSGQKIAHRVVDLADNARVDRRQVAGLVEALAGKPRILRPVPAPLGAHRPANVDDPIDDPELRKRLFTSYEIYHDALANAVLRWRREFDAQRIREEEQRLRKEELKQALREQLAVETQRRDQLREQILEQAQARRRRLLLQAVSGIAAACLIGLILVGLQWNEAGFATARANEGIAYANATRAAEGQATAVAAQATADAERVMAVVARETAVESMREATDARAEAEALREQADRRKAALELASAAMSALAEDPQLSLLLALQASQLTRNPNDTTPTATPAIVPMEAQQALHQALHASRLELPLYGHTRGVNGIAFSPNGARLVTGDSEGKALVWDADRGGDPLFSVDLAGPIRAVAFSPDGTRFAIASGDGTVQLWEATSGSRVMPPILAGQVQAVTFSPDGTQLATAAFGDGGEEAPGVAALWDARSGALIRTFDGHNEAVLSIAFSPDGRRVATGDSDWLVRVWDVDQPEPRWVRHRTDERVRSVAFSPDGRRLASGHGSGVVHVWDANTGDEIAAVQAHNGGTRSLAYSPDGRWLATAGTDRRARLWDATTHEEVLTFAGSGDEVRAIAFRPDSHRLATGGADQIVRIWSTVFEFDHGGPIRDVAFSPAEDRLATAGVDGLGKVWNAVTGLMDFALPHGLDSDFTVVHRVVYNPDGTLLATAGANARAKLWDADSGTLIRTFCEDEPTTCHVNEIEDAAFSPDGSRLVTAGRDPMAKVWDVNSGRLLANLDGHIEWVSGVAFSPNGAWLATGSWDGDVRLWDPSTNQPLGILPSPYHHPVLRVAFSKDSRLLVAGRLNGDVEMWDVASGSRVLGWVAHGGNTNDVAFGASGAELATAGDDRTAKLWGVGTDLNLRLVLAQAGEINAVAFSPDGARLATGGARRQAAIYVVDQTQLIKLAQSKVKRRLTLEECERYLRQPVCP